MRDTRLWPVAVVAVLTVFAGVALGGSGTLTSTGTVSGSSPGPYTVTFNEAVAGVTVGDDFGAFLDDGTSAIYRVTSINTGSKQLTVADVRTSSYGSAFGPPSSTVGSSCWYATPKGAGGDTTTLAAPPKAARAWDAALNLNAANLAGRVLARAGAASVSSSNSSYAAARSVNLPTDLWTADGDSIEITANLQLAAGSGVNMRLEIGTTDTTAITTAGTYVFRLVRVDSNSILVCSGDSTFDTVSDALSLPYVTISLQIMGGDTAGGSQNDFWVVSKVR